MQVTGLRTSMPLAGLVWRTVVVLPALAVFPLALLVSGFLTVGERQRLHGLWRRARGGGGPPAPPERRESEADAVEALETQALLDAGEKGGVTA
jgi:hypothetical protein